LVGGGGGSGRWFWGRVEPAPPPPPRPVLDPRTIQPEVSRYTNSAILTPDISGYATAIVLSDTEGYGLIHKA